MCIDLINFVYLCGRKMYGDALCNLILYPFTNNAVQGTLTMNSVSTSVTVSQTFILLGMNEWMVLILLIRLWQWAEREVNSGITHAS